MKWITRERPKVDRLACPWLIRKFIDRNAEFLFVPSEKVMAMAKELGAIPFDVPDAEYTHYEENATFDYFLKKHNLTDPALKKMARIIRGADTDRHDIAPEAAGLWAISAGLSHNIGDDHQLLAAGFVLYDALYSWACHFSKSKHLENSPFEKLLHEVYLKFVKSKAGKGKPKWVRELKQLVQDHLDTEYYEMPDLKKLSDELDLNASYLSREFSKHFDDMNFVEYIRSARIQKAISLFENPDYSLTEIAYLTGFSDQSHFTRIFRNVTGYTPSVYRKKMQKK